MDLLSTDNIIETSETALNVKAVWAALQNVKDPEIPVLNVIDMGIIYNVEITTVQNNKSICAITMTPTFVGCPAIDIMKKSVQEEVMKLGFDFVEVKVDFENIWTSDRMSEEAKIKLEKFGLAPPVVIEGELTEAQLNNVRCPHCHSTDTTLRSAFGSTLCRAIRFCFNCKQGFEQFKPV